MSVSDALSIMQNAITVVLKMAAPILLLSMLIGIVISVFQAATQIHEQTLTFVPKLIVVALVLLLAGGWMLQTLIDFTNSIMDLMAG